MHEQIGSRCIARRDTVSFDGYQYWCQVCFIDDVMKQGWYGTLPCQFLLRGIRHRQHGHHRHRFCPFSLTVARVIGPFCMYGSCIARTARMNDTIVNSPSGVVQVLRDDGYDTGAGGKVGKERVMNPIFSAAYVIFIPHSFPAIPYHFRYSQDTNNPSFSNAVQLEENYAHKLCASLIIMSRLTDLWRYGSLQKRSRHSDT